MAGPEKIVVDASVVVKWFNPEELSTKALKLRSKYTNAQVRLFAPNLLAYEVINALRWNKEFNEKDVLSASQSLKDIGIVYKDFSLESAIKIAYRYGLTVYDATYLALAKELHGLLVTADKKLIEKRKKEECINSLEDYELC